MTDKTPPDALSAPRSAVQATDGPAEPRDGHGGSEAAQSGSGQYPDTLAIEPYRNDQNQQRWVFRCWGTDTCDGLLSLDHTSRQWAERARDRHVTEEHDRTTLGSPVTSSDSPDNPLREQIAAAIEDEVYEYRERTMFWEETGGVTQEIAKLATRGAMTVRDREMERLRAKVAEIDHIINWHTTCASCARILDSSYAETMRREQAEAALTRVAHVADLIEAGAPWTANRANTARRIRDAANTSPHDAGPSVKECADADRVWPLQKHGE